MWRVGVLLAALLLPASTATARAQVELRSVPEPDLSSMDEAVRHRLEAMQRALRALTAEGAPAAQLAEAYGQMGRYYLAFELMDASQAAFLNARDLAPGDFRWPYFAGIVYQSKGQPQEAAETYEAALTLRPDDLATSLRLGSVYLELDEPEKARAHYRQALSLEPQSAAHYGLGKVAAARDEYAVAVEHFETALELEPEANVVHYPLSQAYRRLGDMEQARQHLRLRGRQEVTFPDPLGSQIAWLATDTAFEVVLALAERREDFSERDFLGFALSQLGDVEGATERLEDRLRLRTEQAQTLDSQSVAAAQDRLARARIHYLLGGLRVKEGAEKAAAGHFRTALKLAPELEDTRIKLGNVLARQGDFQQAIEEYSLVLERNPANQAALLKRAAARMSLNQDRPAAQDLAHLVELEPRHEEGRLRLAQAYERLGRLAEAAHHYQASLELNLEVRTKALTHYQLGKVEVARQRLDAARHHFAASIELDPQLADAHFQLATTSGRGQDYDGAARSYRRLLEIDPQHLGARLGEATALLLLGQEQEARQRLEEGTVAIPQSLEIAHALAHLLATAQDRSARDGERAVSLALKVVTSLPTLEHAVTLAMAFAEAGRFDDAMELQRSLVDQAEARGDQAALPALRRNLTLYKNNQPCCEARVP